MQVLRSSTRRAAAGSSPAPRRRRDRGVTMVEILISIVLMGTAVGATMSTLRSTIVAGTLQRDHANAHAWLQSASDLIYAAPKTPCNPSVADGGENGVRTAYEAVADGVSNPEGWSNWQISVVGPIQFWNATDVNNDRVPEYSFGSACHEDVGLSLQLIELQVRSPNGRIVETVEIVK